MHPVHIIRRLYCVIKFLQLVFEESQFLLFAPPFSLFAMRSLTLSVFLGFVSSAIAANHQVQVGGTSLTYSPNTVQAQPGDTIEFIVNGVSPDGGIANFKGTRRHRSRFRITM